MVTHRSTDRFGCIAELRSALLRRPLDEFEHDGDVSPSARQAACAVAIALGKCRLFNVDPGELGGTLPARLALAAMAVLLDLLSEWIDDARRLAEQWEAANNDIERDDLCATLLENRMDAWAILVALDESWEAHLARSESMPRGFSPAMEQLTLRLGTFDEALCAQEVALSAVCELPLLENWRTMLRDSPFVEHGLPWWLDGTLEATAAWIDADGAKEVMLFQWINERAEIAPVRLTKSWMQRQIEQTYSVAAAPATKPESRKGQICITWHSPDGKFLAQLVIPKSADLKTGFDMTIKFVHVDPRGVAAANQFQKVRIAGMSELSIPPDQAEVSRSSLEFFDQADDEPRLFVDGKEWTVEGIIGGET